MLSLLRLAICVTPQKYITLSLSLNEASVLDDLRTQRFMESVKYQPGNATFYILSVYIYLLLLFSCKVLLLLINLLKFIQVILFSCIALTLSAVVSWFTGCS